MWCRQEHASHILHQHETQTVVDHRQVPDTWLEDTLCGSVLSHCSTTLIAFQRTGSRRCFGFVLRLGCGASHYAENLIDQGKYGSGSYHDRAHHYNKDVQHFCRTVSFAAAAKRVAALDQPIVHNPVSMIPNSTHFPHAGTTAI